MSKTRLDEIFEVVAIRSGNSPNSKSVRKHFFVLYQFILEQLELNGKIMIPKFGTFYLRQKEEKVMKVGDPINNGSKYIYVEPRYYIEFVPSNYFDRSINENKFKLKKEFKPLKKIKKTKQMTKTRTRKPLGYSTAQALNLAVERKNGENNNG